MSGCDIPDRSRSPRLATPSGAGRVWKPPIWAYDAQPQVWANPTSSLAPPGYTWSFRWESAMFDLRPDLTSQIGQIKQGYPIEDTAARLYILLTGNQGSAFSADGMEVNAVNYVQVWNASPQAGAGAVPGSTIAPNLVPLTAVDVTSDFYPGGVTSNGIAAVVFSPPGTAAGGGEGYPIRYWRLSLNFQFFVSTVLPLPPAVAPDTIVITAGMF